MANTKQTKRKKIETLCPLCKHMIDEDKFVEHLLLCKKKSFCCVLCKLFFKKETYLNKHKKRVHGSTSDAFPGGSNIEQESGGKSCDILTDTVPKNMQDNKSGLEQESGDKRCNVSRNIVPEDKQDDDSSSNSDWDQDPDIEIDVETCEKQEQSQNTAKNDKAGENKDSRLVNDKRVGRIYRKRTNPNPVIAPVKVMKVTEEKAVVNTQSVDQNEMSGDLSDNDNIELSDREDRNELPENQGTEDSSVKKEKDGGQDDGVTVQHSNKVEEGCSVKYDLEKEKLEIEKRKLDLEIAKFEYKKSLLDKITDLASRI
ncbi:general transcription factor IIF subunit 1-like [Mercenaria mercenaria]|uniref:general transcription factor IIF subunit 1-like n=1 Tax=Mercenaria mercenaria TaxID=6596 RepID=UPI00234F0DC4|nr:general transcription factor IIF subunit 1-like [Mercenaria mercenaria]